MMLDINLDLLRQGFWQHFPLAATVGAVVALELAAVLMGGFRVSEAPAVAQVAPAAAGAMPAQISNTRELGIALYTHYLYPLQIAAAILLVAMVAAIALTLRKRRDSKYQNPSEQVRVRAQDRLEIVKMEPVRPAPPAPVEEKQA
jgi:NADH-quinone oxidoreductase subunit J